MFPMTRSATVALIILFLLGTARVALSQRLPRATPPPPPAAAAPTPAPPSVEEITRARDDLQRRPDPSEAIKQAIQKYDAALASLTAAKQSQEASAELERLRLAVATELEATQARLAEPIDTVPRPAADATLDQLRRLRDEADASLQAARDKIKELEDEKAKRDRRTQELPGLKEQLRTQVEQVEVDLLAPALPEEDPELARARRTELLARHLSLMAQVDAIDRELANDEARKELLPLRQQRWRSTAEARDKLAKAWRDLVNQRETAAAREEEAAARRARAGAHPVVQAAAQLNLELANRRAEVLTTRTKAQKDLERIDDELEAVTARLMRARSWTTVSAFSDIVDVRLRSERSALPDLQAMRRQTDARRIELSRLQLEVADRRFELTALPSVLEQKERILEDLEADLPPEITALVAAQLDQDLVEQRAKYVSYLSAAEEVLDLLVATQAKQLQLITVTEQFRQFIDANVLWLRSMDPVGATTVKETVARVGALTQPDEVNGLVQLVWVDLQQAWLPHAAALLLFLAALAAGRPLRRLLRRIADSVSRLTTDTMARTWEALLATVLLALRWPIFLWYVAWRLGRAGEGDLVQAVAQGLDAVAWQVLAIEFIRALCGDNGLAQAHFSWTDRTRQGLIRNLVWFAPPWLILQFVAQGLEASTGLGGTDEPARLAFMGSMALMAAFTGRVLRPARGVLSNYLSDHRGGWVHRTRYLWIGAAVLLPVALGVAAALGYFYLAIRCEQRLIQTFWLGLAAIVINSLVLRWLFLARRRMALEEARRRAAARSTADAAAPKSTEATTAPAEVGLNVGAIDIQVRRVVRTVLILGMAAGLFSVWREMVPALGILQRVELWPQFRVASAADLAQFDIQPSQATAGGSRPASAPATPPAPGTPPAGGAAAPAAPAGNGAAAPAEGATAAASSQPSLTATLGMSGLSPDGAAGTGAAPAERSVVTLLDVTVSLLILLVAIVLARNLPGLLEIALLQRLPMAPSARYATTTIVRYILLIVGTVVAFNSVGIGWSKVQWLVAALTVGLGFGLQEVVANFVSGLIILFERPVRLGDTVTVGQVSGTVSRIRIRATTITDWDRKELIIPNKEFITGQVINWSLSDTILRLRVPVGVAYGSDTDRAKRLMLEVAESIPSVLKEPKPQALFLGFGDSTLNLELRVFLPSVDYLVEARDQLHTRIDEAFREAAIEIAFPQRDIHIRSISGPLVQAASSGGAVRGEAQA
jgi:potassium efflux system protein